MATLWLDRCVCEHDTCNEEQNGTFLPSRLIEIYESGGKLEGRLVSTEEPMETMCRSGYFALSYCWGTDRGKTVSKTTRDTLSMFQEGIDVATLPKTFRDAMFVVRKMKYHYIWIDSLCIVQDDPEDFVRECSMMGRIYANSLCTISVSHNDNKNMVSRAG